MALVLKDAHDGAGRPFVVSRLCAAAQVHQDFRNLIAVIAVQKQEKDQPHSLRLIFINHQVTIFVFVVTKQFRCQEDTSGETHFNGGIHDLALGMGFLLG